MKKYTISGALIALWICLSLLFTSHLNLKRYTGDSGPTFFTDTGYNFEYKYGFPTPWYSRYYQIPANQLNKYQGTGHDVATPSHSYLVYTDISKPVLVVQIVLAAIPSLILLLVSIIIRHLSKRGRITKR
jgi:hypothetical protein